MWIYEGKTVVEETIPEKAVGFVYLIGHKNKDMLYLGRKLLTKAAIRQVAGKKIKYRKASDWETYWGSSPSLLAILEEEGTDNFQREILAFTYSKAETNYLEESLQYKLDVLVKDRWINNNIRAKVFRKNVLKYQCHEKANALVQRFSK
jgi:hypothetical protein